MKKNYYQFQQKMTESGFKPDIAPGFLFIFHQNTYGKLHKARLNELNETMG